MIAHKRKLFSKTGVFFLALAFLPLTAHAGGLLSQVADILKTYIRPTDESMAMLRTVFGDFSFDPFNTNLPGNGSLLGAMFLHYNEYIFTIGTLWMAYNIFAGLAHTMHEGVVLGKRMSTIWVPLRVTFGAVSLIPAFGGWAFCQALMMIAALLGIAGANFIAETAITSAASFKVLVNPQGSVKGATTLNGLEEKFVKYMICTQNVVKLREEQSRPEYAVGVAVNYAVNPQQIGNTIVVNFPGAIGGPTGSGCGRIKLEFSPRKNGVIGASSFGFRLNNINYEGIRQVAMNAHMQALQSIRPDAQLIARGVSNRLTDTEFKAGAEAIKNGYFGSYSRYFAANLQSLTAAATSASNITAIDQQLTQQMLDGGWATLGIWYSVFAETNQAMNEMLDPTVSFFDYSDDGQTSVESDATAGFDAIGNYSGATVSTATGGAGAATTATGNVSVGQWIMSGVLDSLVRGGTTGGGNDTLNPILAFKTLGDNALVAAETMIIAAKAAEILADTAEKSVVTKVAGWIPGVGTIKDILLGVAKQFGALILSLGYMLFLAALVMSVYIPMIPFIQWFAALLQWFTSIVESLIGSSLWALAHFDADGEGMGQRAQHGYLYLLNNFARPIIMVFAFFIASAAIVVLGTFLFKFFGNSVAAVQGNSITGVVSIVGFVIIFMIMGVSLINGAFNLLLSQANKVIGWIGSNGHDSGHDIEGRINSVFINAARTGQGLFAPKGPKSPGSLAPQGVKPGGKGGGGKTSEPSN